jgi:hypothetical protein
MDRERMKKTAAKINLFMIPPVLSAREYRLRVNAWKTSRE